MFYPSISTHSVSLFGLSCSLSQVLQVLVWRHHHTHAIQSLVCHYHHPHTIISGSLSFVSLSPFQRTSRPIISLPLLSTLSLNSSPAVSLSFSLSRPAHRASLHSSSQIFTSESFSWVTSDQPLEISNMTPCETLRLSLWGYKLSSKTDSLLFCALIGLCFLYFFFQLLIFLISS